MEDLSDFALHSQSQREYRQLVLGKLIELLGLDAGLLWQSDGLSYSLTRPPGMNDDLGEAFSGYVSEFSPAEVEQLLNARSVSDVDLFPDVRREQLSLYTRYLRPNRIRGFVSRAWKRGGSFHIIAFCRGNRLHEYDLEKANLDTLFPVIALGDALTRPVRGERSVAELSLRERQVLECAALGRSNKEIAYALGLAHSTVRVLLTRAAKKLGASTRAQVIQRFIQLNQCNAVRTK